jgi:hypothetical protein
MSPVCWCCNTLDLWGSGVKRASLVGDGTDPRPRDHTHSRKATWRSTLLDALRLAANIWPPILRPCGRDRPRSRPGGSPLSAALDELEWQRWLVSDGRGYVFVARIVERIIERDMLTPGQRRRMREAAGRPA